MNRDWWILIPCIIILIACVIALSVMRFAKSTNTTEYLAPDFETMFRQMTANDNILLTAEKPFQVMSTTHVQPSTQAYTVNDSVSTIQPVVANTVIGFVFVPTQSIDITHVQILARCVLETKTVLRQVSLFDRTSQEFFGGASVNLQTAIVNSEGFYTIPLDTIVSLQAGRAYVIVTQAVPLDVIVLNTATTGVRFVNSIQFQTGAQTSNSGTVAFPLEFPTAMGVFVGFQFRRSKLLDESLPVFGVEPANGGIATSPPSYLNGLITSIPSTGTSLLVQPGVASNQTDTVTIVLPLPTRIDITKNGLNGLDTGTLAANTWYYVFAVSSDSSSLPSGCLLSLGRTTPLLLPNGYVNYRRIGSVKTIATDVLLLPMQQENKGRRRTTFYTGDEVPRQVVTDGLTTDAFVPVSITSAPPTASEVSLGVRGRMDVHTPFDTTTPINAVVTIRPVFDITQSSTLGIPNMNETYGQINLPLSNIAQQYVEYRLYAQPGTGGSVPNSEEPFEKFYIDIFTIKYVEVL